MFEALVARQAGVVSLAHAAAHGYSPDRVRRRVREGRWRMLHPGVVPRSALNNSGLLRDAQAAPSPRLPSGPIQQRYRPTRPPCEDTTWTPLATAGVVQDPPSRRPPADGRGAGAAAWLWASEGSVVSGAAAAHWHGMLARPPTVVDLTVPSRTGARSRSGVRLHRRDLTGADVAVVRGLRVAGRGLTALEAAIEQPDGSAFLDRALQRHVPFDDVYGAYCRALGRRGSADMGRLLIAAADRADSAAERVLLRLLREAGITGWVVGHPFGRYQIDVAFPGARVAIEIDGWAWHVDQDRFVNDRRKGNALVQAGWVVLRFTWHDLVGSPHSVVAQIVAALARAA